MKPMLRNALFAIPLLYGLAWAARAYALDCPAPKLEAVTLELVAVTTDGQPGGGSRYQGGVVRLTVKSPGNAVDLSVTDNSTQLLTEAFDVAR